MRRAVVGVTVLVCVMGGHWGPPLHARTVGAGTQLNSYDMRRMLAMARAPDAERARFHAPYIFTVTGASLDDLRLDSVEVITELRRLELLAEQHARINDSFGGGGLRDVEDAMRPWSNKLAIVARLSILPTHRVIAGPPPVAIGFLDATDIRPLETRRDGVYSGSGDTAFLVGATVEAVFDVASVRATSRPVVVQLDDKEIGRATIDFGALR